MLSVTNDDSKGCEYASLHRKSGDQALAGQKAASHITAQA
jgi:hypothetical protein